MGQRDLRRLLVGGAMSVVRWAAKNGAPEGYWLLWTLRSLAPKRSQWRKAQFDTIRLRLMKVAAKVTEYATRVVVQLPSVYPDQAIARLLGAKVPKLTAPP